MELQQMRGFQSVARLGSISRAAQATLRTQSAVSQQIKALEEELGLRLFERLGQRLLGLTPAGERLLESCDRLFREYEDLRADLEALRGPAGGRLSLAAPFTSLYQLLPRVIAGFSQAYPQVTLNVLDRPQEEVIALLRQGAVDLGLALQSRLPADLMAYRWKKVRPVVMVPVGHSLARAQRLELGQVARYPLILPGPGAARQDLDRRLARLGLRVQVVMESSNVELSALYASQGLGLAFATLAEDAAPAHGQVLSLIPLGRGFAADYLAVATHRRRRLHPWQQAFLERLLAT